LKLNKKDFSDDRVDYLVFRGGVCATVLCDKKCCFRPNFLIFRNEIDIITFEINVVGE